ncbi:MAG: universal stress protein, partial [Pseudomonadota bacterium]
MCAVVLVAVDTSDAHCWPMLRKAVQPYANGENTVHLVHVVPEDEALGPLSQFVPDGFVEQHRKATHDVLDRMSKDIPAGTSVTLHLRTGHAYVAVLDLADTIAADLIVVGSNRPDLRDYLIGP